MGARPGGPGLLSLVKTLVMRSIKFIYFKKEGKYFIPSSNWDEDQEGPVTFFREGWAIRQWDPGVCVGAGRRQGPGSSSSWWSFKSTERRRDQQLASTYLL